MWCFLNVQIVRKLCFYLVIDSPCFRIETLHEVNLISWIQFTLFTLSEFLYTVQVVNAVSSFGQTFLEFGCQMFVSLLWCKRFYYEWSPALISFFIFNRYKISWWIFNTAYTQNICVALQWRARFSFLTLEPIRSSQVWSPFENIREAFL